MNGCTYIDKVGLELEGRWDKLPPIPLHKDISIQEEYFSKPKHIGELISPPLDNKENIFSFMEEFWPQERTERCGFHVHFSLKDYNSYCSLMEKKFFSFFTSKIKGWAINTIPDDDLFWRRFNGNNKYCRFEFIPNIQVSEDSKGEYGNEKRYTHLNYCFAMHKTIECRLFPMFEKIDVAKDGLNQLINTFETYLSENPSKDFELKSLIDDKEEKEKEKENNQNIIQPFNFFTTRFYGNKLILMGKKKDEAIF